MAILRTQSGGAGKIIERGNGAAMVFLHSGVGSAGEWREVFSRWPAGYRLIAVDAYRGGDGPGTPGHRTLDDYAPSRSSWTSTTGRARSLGGRPTAARRSSTTNAPAETCGRCS